MTGGNFLNPETLLEKWKEKKLTYQQLLDEGTRLLQEAGVPSFDWDARWLLEDASELTRTDFLIKRNETASEAAMKCYAEWILRRSTREPLQQIVGYQEFMGLDFTVTPDVLCPRQDTETLVELALDKIRPKDRILDICTGSGCILISLLVLGNEKFLDVENAEITGVGTDISEKALEVAKYNGAKYHVNAQWLLSDLAQQAEGMFDMIVSNPPYIPTEVCETLMPEVKDHEPRIALDGDTDGLKFYRLIAASAKEHLKEGGWLIFEIGYDQEESVTRIMKENGYKEISAVKDLGRNPRVVLGKR